MHRSDETAPAATLHGARAARSNARGATFAPIGRLAAACVLLGAVLSQRVQGQTPEQTGAPQPAEASEQELLQMSIEQLLEVEVTSATRSPTPLRDAPAIVVVISAEQIRDRGYQTVGEALESVPGLDLLHDHYQYNLGIRGVSPGDRAWSRSVKLMIDGQPVSYRPSQEVWLGDELLPIEAIERIEVIRGPASVLYGANAYLGVINIVTKTGAAVEYGRVTGLFGAGERLINPGGSALAGAAHGGFDVLAAGRVRSPVLRGYRLRNLPGQRHPRDDERSQSGYPLTASGFGKLEYASERLGRVALDVHYQQLERYTEFMDWGVMAHDNLQSLYNFYVRARYSKTFFDAFDWNVGAAVANGAPRARDRLNVAPGLDTHVERDVGYRGYDLFTYAALELSDVARLSLGADYTLDDQELLNYYTVSADGSRALNPPAGTPSGRKHFTNVGVYAHGMFSPFARSTLESMKALGVIAGVRFDHQNIYGSNVNYSAGLVHRLPGELYAKLLFGTSFRAPSSNQLYSNFLDTRGVIGNPNLKPERARTLDFAFGGPIAEYLTFETGAFLTHIESKVETRPQLSAPADNPTPQNLAEIRSRGLEAALNFSFRGFQSYLNYAFQRSWSEEPNRFAVTPGARVKTDTVLYPRHAFKFGLNYKIPAAFMLFNVEGRYLGERLGSESNNERVHGILGVATEHYALPDYFLLDLFVSSHGLQLWDGKETRLGAKVSNLLGTSYAYPGYNGFDIPGFVRAFDVALSQQF